MEKHTLHIKNLHANAEGTEILKGVTLKVSSNETHVIMGPNGSGKSTLCNVLFGHPKYEITDGEIWFDDENITEWKPDKRAQLGLFLGFQYPREIPGVPFSQFLRASVNAIRTAQDSAAKPLSVMEFSKLLEERMEFLEMPKEFRTRGVNEGFSGGEKKRAEIAQLLMLEPRIAILDETDSGLDVDALKIVSKGINKGMKDFGFGLLLITHYQRLLDYIKPDFVHIMSKGKIVLSGDAKLAHEVEKSGYEQYIK